MPKKKLKACGECEWFRFDDRGSPYDQCKAPAKFNQYCNDSDFNSWGQCPHFKKIG